MNIKRIEDKNLRQIHIFIESFRPVHRSSSVIAFNFVVSKAFALDCIPTKVHSYTQVIRLFINSSLDLRKDFACEHRNYVTASQSLYTGANFVNFGVRKYSVNIFSEIWVLYYIFFKTTPCKLLPCQMDGSQQTHVCRF